MFSVVTSLFEVGILTDAKWMGPKGSPVKEASDPYFAWLDYTVRIEVASAGVDRPKRASSSTEARVELLIELLAKEIGPAMDALDDAGLRLRWPSVHDGFKPRFLSGSLPLNKMPLLKAKAESLGIRWELASARFVADPDRSGAISPMALKRLLAGTVSRSTAPMRNSESVKGREVESGQLPVWIVDDFCNLGSISVAKRLRSLWDQGRASPSPDAVSSGARRVPARKGDQYWLPQRPVQRPIPSPGQPSESPAEVYGALLDLGRVEQQFGVPETRTDELRLYRELGMSSAVNVWSHGTAVMGALLCPAFDGLGQPTDARDRTASPSDLHFVQLPNTTVLDTSGGSLGAFALDALHRACREAIASGSRALIVNLSYGTQSGSHDGSSMFERALGEMLRHFDGSASNRPALHVVLPAGNTHDWRAHATLTVAPGSHRQVQWMVMPDTETDSFLELWFNQPDSIRVTLEAPNAGEKLTDVQRGTVVAMTSPVDKSRLSQQDDKGAPAFVTQAAVLFPWQQGRSDSRSMALVAIAPTRRRRDMGTEVQEIAGQASGAEPVRVRRVPMEAPAGCWTVTVHNTSTDHVVVDAWVQRQDAAPGRARGARGFLGRQSYLIDTPGAGVDPYVTLNGIATLTPIDNRLWVVGAMDARGALSPYSAAGPSRRPGDRFEGPDVVVPVDTSRNTPGLRAHGTLSGTRIRIGGTSLAAAVFARQLHHAISASGGQHWTASWVQRPATLPYEGDPPRPAGQPRLASDDQQGRLHRLSHPADISIRRR